MTDDRRLKRCVCSKRGEGSCSRARAHLQIPWLSFAGLCCHLIIISRLAQQTGSVSTERSFSVPLGPLWSTGSDDEDMSFKDRLRKQCMNFAAISGTPDQINVTFHLYTRDNPSNAYITTPEVSRHHLLTSSPFRPHKPVKWIIHGFHTNIDKSDWMIELKDKILAYEDANVFLTDWGQGAQPALSFYPKAAANVHVVAKLIVDMIKRISDDIDFRDLHLIGHSLGAHIMGFVGTAFTGDFIQSSTRTRKLSGSSDRKLVGRITGCDPALPCFGPSSMAPQRMGGDSSITASDSSPSDSSSTSSLSPTSLMDGSSWQGFGNFWPTTPKLWTHLDRSSALVVEVMHTNAGALGYTDSIGDFDFYPNGADLQPGCGPQKEAPAAEENANSGGGGLDITPITSAITRLVWSPQNFVQGYTCSHRRSVEYLIESLYSERVPPELKFEPQFACQMVAYKCANYNTFKQGFCSKCFSTEDCRIFGMTHSPPRPARQIIDSVNKFNRRAINHLNLKRQQRVERSLYYFDTRNERNFCTYHYNLVVRYRRYKIHDDATIENAFLIGSTQSGSHLGQLLFSKLSSLSYTALISVQKFLGQLETLLIWGEELRPKMIEFIEVRYMSNLDPQVRAFYSARLCQAPSIPSNLPELLSLSSSNHTFSLHTAVVFVRCSGMKMV